MIGSVGVGNSAQQITQEASRHSTVILNVGEGVIYLATQAVVSETNSLPLGPGYGTTIYPGIEIWAKSENGIIGQLIVAAGLGAIFAAGV